MGHLNFSLGSVVDGETSVEANVSIESAGNPLSIGSDGALGTFSPGKTLTVMVRVPARYHLESFCAHRDKDTGGDPIYQMLKGVTWQDQLIYRWNVKTQGKPPKGFTQWPDNQIYVVAKLGKGHFRIFQVSIAAQDYRLYLRTQMLYGGQVVEKDGKPVISDPYFLPWQGLDDVIIKRFQYQSLALEPAEYEVLNWDWVDEPGVITNESHIPHFKSDDLSEGKGRVDYFTESKGTGGVVVRWHGKLYCARLHQTALPGDKGFRTIMAGQVFNFDRFIKARDDSWEVKGVSR